MAATADTKLEVRDEGLGEICKVPEKVKEILSS